MGLRNGAGFFRDRPVGASGFLWRLESPVLCYEVQVFDQDRTWHAVWPTQARLARAVRRAERVAGEDRTRVT